MGWAIEMVQQGKLDYIRISFMIAGHTKFAPNQLFSKISQTFSKSDVFNTAELAQIAQHYAYVVVDEGDLVFNWRGCLRKYSKLPGVRGMHDFIFVCSSDTGQRVISKIRQLCYAGIVQDSPIHVSRGYSETQNVIPTASQSNQSKARVKILSEPKLAHLRQISANFIPVDRHMPILWQTHFLTFHFWA